MSPALEHARTHLADLREELAAARPSARRPPGLRRRPAGGDGDRQGRLRGRRGDRDRLLPRAARRPPGRLARRRELARHQRDAGAACRRARLPARPGGRSSRRSAAAGGRRRRPPARRRRRPRGPPAAAPAAIGRRVRDHLDHLEAARAPERRGEPRRQRPGAARDPDPRAPHAAVAHQRADDLARRRVDRHREAEADRRPPPC